MTRGVDGAGIGFIVEVLWVDAGSARRDATEKVLTTREREIYERKARETERLKMRE